MQYCLSLRAAMTVLATLAFTAPAPALQTFRGATPVGRNFTFLPLRIAEQNGVLAKNGLDIEVADFGGGAKLQQAFVAGAIDLAVSAGTDIAFIAKGANERAEISEPSELLSVSGGVTFHRGTSQSAATSAPMLDILRQQRMLSTIKS